MMGRISVAAELQKVQTARGIVGEQTLAFKVLSRMEAINGDVDEEKSLFLADDDNRRVEWYILYNDHPDYCFVFEGYTSQMVYRAIDGWFDELEIKPW